MNKKLNVDVSCIDVMRGISHYKESTTLNFQCWILQIQFCFQAYKHAALHYESNHDIRNLRQSLNFLIKNENFK